MADAPDLGSGVYDVGVQVPSSAPKSYNVRKDVVAFFVTLIHAKLDFFIRGLYNFMYAGKDGNMKKTLIVVDMQNDFIDMALGTKEAVAIVPRVKAKIEAYRKNGDIIIYTRDSHGADYLDSPEGKKLPVLHCVKGTKGWEIADGLYIDGCKVIDKPNFGWPNWQDETFEAVELVGLCTDICVVSNALILKAVFPDIQVSVDATCCAGVSPESHKAALVTMKMCQIDVIGE